MTGYDNMPGSWASESSSVPAGQSNFAGGSPSDYNNYGSHPIELPAHVPTQLNPAFEAEEVRNDGASGASTIAHRRPKIIAIFGQTGTGKTSFVRAVTGQDLKVGHSLTSCTEHVQAVQCRIGHEDVILVDTPGFSDTNLSDTEVLRRIATWMKDTYDEGSFLSGIVYLHAIINTRMTGPSLTNLRMMRKLCGSDSLKNMVLATTMWEQVSAEIGQSREEDLKRDFWKDMIAGGSTVSRIAKNNSTEALAIIKNMLNNTPVPTRLQEQLSVGMSLQDTDAGSEIRAELAKLEEKFKQDLQEAREELEKANSNRDRRDRLLAQSLKAEIEQVNQKLQQVEQDRDLLKRSTPKSLPKVKREGLFGLAGYHCKRCWKHTNNSGKWTCSSCSYVQINRW